VRARSDDYARPAPDENMGNREAETTRTSHDEGNHAGKRAHDAQPLSAPRTGYGICHAFLPLPFGIFLQDDMASQIYPKPALHLALYYFIKLNNHAIWVKRKSTAKFPGGRLEQRMRWYDKDYSFALQICVDRIKTMDPEPNVRDPYLIGLNTRAPR
jgi:hypothetical protein